MMNLECMQTASALLGIGLILLGSFRLKRYLRRIY